MTDPALSLSVLGPIEAVRRGSPVRLGGPLPRRLLALLTVHANHVVPSDRLIDVLWGDAPPESAPHTLQTKVRELRRVLGPDRIETAAPGYRLRVDRDEVDTLRFEDLVAAGRASADRPEDAVSHFSAALALWRGRPYTEFADEDFARVEVARLEDLRLGAVEDRAAALIALGRATEVVAELEAEIAAEPLRESLQALYMTALARAGRPAEAVRAFDAYCRTLDDELETKPSSALQALNADILRQHPDLDWERPPASRAADELPTGTLTTLFTDIEGSTRLWQEHRIEMVDALARHFELLRAAIGAHGGHEVKTTGDGIHAVFENASDAIEAAIAAQLALCAEPWPEAVPLWVRMGLHTGESSPSEGDYYGPAVNQAARLMGLAHGGQIVCSGVVKELAGGHDDYEDLGLHRLRGVDLPLHLYQVNAPGLESKFPPLASLDAYRSNLPLELSGFVGRADDVTAVAKGLAEARVVSIVGVGGVGKTRLALRVGAELRPAYADGVWWCELAGVRDPDAFPEAVAAAFGYAPSQGLSTTEGLAGFFRHKHLALILDNCEHLLAAVARFVRAVVEDAPRLTVLTTSREALGIAGERTYLLPALEVPADPSPFSVEESEAGALFVARARDASGSFAVTEENAAAIADLCTHLDGNALAIELAAARTTVMSPSEIRDRLDQRFRLLAARSGDAAERHQTLHAAIDWSYALLAEPEQALLQSLSVFVGDFDLAAATTVGAAAGLEDFDAIDGLHSLVAKSLVERNDAEGTSRYRLLETIREYAAERLARDGDAGRVRDEHAAHYLAAAGSFFAMLDTARDFEALECLRADAPNLVAGLRWLLASDRMPAVLGFFADTGWVDSGIIPFELLDELGRVADEAVRQRGAEQARGYIDALFFIGNRTLYVGDWERYHHVVAVGCEADPESLPMQFLNFGVAMTSADFSTAVEISAATVDQARRGDNVRLVSQAYTLLSLGEFCLGADPDATLAHADAAVEFARRSPAVSASLCALNMLAAAAQHLDPDRALAAAEECIRVDETHRKSWSTMCTTTAAMLRIDRGELAAGLRLLSDVLHRFDWAGEVFPIAVQLPGIAELLAGTHAELALEIAAIAESGAVAPNPIFAAPAGMEWLPPLVERCGREALEAARSRAASMSYDSAIARVFDILDGLIADAEAAEAADV